MGGERTVTSIVDRFQGRAPQAVPAGSVYREQRIFQTLGTEWRAQVYEGNRRVIRYSSLQEIPPVIVASQQLNRVQLLPQAQSTYSVRPQAPQQGRYQNDIPPSCAIAPLCSWAVPGSEPQETISRGRGSNPLFPGSESIQGHTTGRAACGEAPAAGWTSVCARTDFAPSTSGLGERGLAGTKNRMRQTRSDGIRCVNLLCYDSIRGSKAGARQSVTSTRSISSQRPWRPFPFPSRCPS